MVGRVSSICLSGGGYGEKVTESKKGVEANNTHVQGDNDRR